MSSFPCFNWINEKTNECRSLVFHYHPTSGQLPVHFWPTFDLLGPHMGCPIIQFYKKIEFCKKVASKDPFRQYARDLKIMTADNFSKACKVLIEEGRNERTKDISCTQK